MAMFHKFERFSPRMCAKSYIKRMKFQLTKTRRKIANKSKAINRRKS